MRHVDVAAGLCRHWMHQSCLLKWMAKSMPRICPVCRKPLIQDSSQNATGLDSELLAGEEGVEEVQDLECSAGYRGDMAIVHCEYQTA